MSVLKIETVQSNQRSREKIVNQIFFKERVFLKKKVIAQLKNRI